MPINEHQKKYLAARKAERERLRALPVEELIGLVEPKSRSTGKVQGETEFEASFFFLAWRTAKSSVIDRKKMRLVQLAKTQREASDCIKGIRDWQVISVRARVDRSDAPMFVSALVDTILGPRRDAEFQALKKKLQKDHVIVHPRLGRLKLDRTSGTFRGNASFARAEVEFTIASDSDEHLGQNAQVVDAILRDALRWKREALEYAEREFRTNYNTTWRLDQFDGQDSPKMSKKDFMRELRLAGIWVTSADSIAFDIDAGDVFGGHSIQVMASLSKGITDGELIG